jgi:two-component system sensor histidine kinase BaeS
VIAEAGGNGSARAWRLGPLGRRLFAAFAVVALASVALLAFAAIVAANRGIDTARQSDRQSITARAAAAASEAYSGASGWTDAQLGTVQAIAEAAGAALTVQDAVGRTVYSMTNTGPSMMGGSSMSGMGPGMPSVMNGSGPSASAAVAVAGSQVGSVRLVFASATGSGRPISWPWVLAAALAALALALAVSWYVTRRVTGPIMRVARAAETIAAGDRSARARLSAPGELGELARSFDTMAEDLDRAERSRRNLAADVAHELRTPLAALQAGLEELRDGYTKPDVEQLAALHDQTLRLGRIVGDLAELAEAESGALSLHPAAVDVNTLIEDAVANREPQLRAAGLTVRTHLHPGPLTVLGDGDRLHQALGNLLSNAARYCRPGDTVTISTAQEADRVRIELADTGPGIAPEELPRIFERFWRGSASRAVGGTGIGLAVVKELILAHGGTVTAESPPEQGTRFILRLPQEADVFRRPVRQGSNTPRK